MNQTLEGHEGMVRCVCWNENHRKLTTADQNGLIIVWMLHKGQWCALCRRRDGRESGRHSRRAQKSRLWRPTSRSTLSHRYEEMINNRNQSTVRGMKWTPDGSRICIVYEDGMVIVGSNDGNRLWGKEIKSGDLAHVEWSPDGRNLLFCTAACEVHVYDAHGNFVANLPLYCLESVAGPTALAGVHWYDGAEGLLAIDQPVLAIGLQNGRLQLMRHEVDEEPVLVDSGMTVAELHWSTNGSMLAVSGGEHQRLGTRRSPSHWRVPANRAPSRFRPSPSPPVPRPP